VLQRKLDERNQHVDATTNAATDACLTAAPAGLAGPAAANRAKGTNPPPNPTNILQETA